MTRDERLERLERWREQDRVDFDERLVNLATQVAEQNVRILFLLQKCQFKVKAHGQILMAGQTEVRVITGYEFYMAERERFLAQLEADMLQANEALRQAEADAIATINTSLPPCQDEDYEGVCEDAETPSDDEAGPAESPARDEPAGDRTPAAGDATDRARAPSTRRRLLSFVGNAKEA